jgi:hypothetical protein
MNLKARVQRLEKLQHAKTGAKITIDVFDRIMNDTISDQEFARWKPYLEEIFADRETACELHAQSV